MSDIHISEKDLTFEQSGRRLQDKENRWIADEIYRRTFGDVQIERIDNLSVTNEVKMALDILGVDFSLKFGNDTRLAGQEKFLSHNCKQFRTITISEYSWRHCSAQIYFCGYLTKDGRNFDPWILLNWTNVIWASAASLIKWELTHSLTSYPSFWNTKMDNIPSSCIIASKL